MEGDRDMRKNLFWLSDEQWKRIEPHLPTDVRGVERAEDRRVISGIVHVLKSVLNNPSRAARCLTHLEPRTGAPAGLRNTPARGRRRVPVWKLLAPASHLTRQS